MRNPDRIDPLIEQLRKFWKERPDLRLGQIIENAHVAAGLNPNHGVFHTEDEYIVEGLKKLSKEKYF